VIGDVHACDERLERLLDALAARDIDALWCVGDIVTGPGDPDRCAALLVAAGAVTVRGNHDRWCLEGAMGTLPGSHRLEQLQPATRAFLAGLPAQVEVEAADGTPVLLCHGLGRNDMNGISADDFGYALEVNDELAALRDGCRRIVVKGHRHRPDIWSLGPLTLVDAGTLLPDHTSSCGAVVDLAGGVAWPLALDGPTVSDGPAVPLR
jgi:predicted phosphodiesterase